MRMGTMGIMDIIAGGTAADILFDKGSVKLDFCFPLGLTQIVLNRFSLIKSKDNRSQNSDITNLALSAV